MPQCAAAELHRPGEDDESVDHGAGCYWARLAGFSYDEYANVIEDFSGVADQVTIDPSDVAFQAYGCGTWTRV